MEKRKNKALVILLSVLLLFAALFGGRYFLPAFAVVKYSGALADLKKDANFKASDYPPDVKDNSINVIQIAESVDGELLIYTYQPAQSVHYLVATDINISRLYDFDDVTGESPDNTGGEESGDSAENVSGGGGSGCSLMNEESREAVTQLYSLTLINISGVFGKYLVNDFTVNGEEPKRYYNITSIYRAFDRYIDEQSGLDDTITKVASPVGKLFTAETVDGKPVYYEQTREVVTITEKYVGNVMYEGEADIGWGARNTAINAMYVAFDTDREMDRLYGASVTYSTQSLKYKIKLNFLQVWNNYTVGTAYDVKKGEVIPHKPVTLNYSVTDSAGHYSWYQIQSVNEFKNNMSKNGMELTTDAQEGLQGKKWVLNFANVECEVQWAKDDEWYKFLAPAGLALDDPTFRTTLVSDVSVLSLEFEHDEQMYKLGAVDGASTPSNKPSNKLDGYDDNNEHFSTWQWIKDKLGIGSFKMPWWGWLLIALVVLAIAFPLLGYFIPAFGKFLLMILKAIWKGIKGLWRLICAPFKWIAKLIKKRKSKSKSRSKSKSGKRRRKKKHNSA